MKHCKLTKQNFCSIHKPFNLSTSHSPYACLHPVYFSFQNFSGACSNKIIWNSVLYLLFLIYSCWFFCSFIIDIQLKRVFHKSLSLSVKLIESPFDLIWSVCFVWIKINLPSANSIWISSFSSIPIFYPCLKSRIK